MYELRTYRLLIAYRPLFIGEPTLRQKAELIIRSLRLGVDAGSTTTPPPRPVTTPRLTAFRKKVMTSPSFKVFDKVTTSPSFKILSKVTTRPPSPTINYCPTASQQANNRVCPNICPRGMHCIICTMHSGMSLISDEDFVREASLPRHIAVQTLYTCTCCTLYHSACEVYAWCCSV